MNLLFILFFDLFTDKAFEKARMRFIVMSLGPIFFDLLLSKFNTLYR